MFSIRYILAAVVPLFALALAQSIAFTSTPAIVEAGESYNITWGGGDGTAVTLTLRRGTPSDLTTVTTIADSVTGSSYLWDAPSTLEDGVDYAFQITQGQSDINYSGLFTVQGGSGSSSSSSSASSTASMTASMTGGSNSTMSITSAASASGTGTAISRNSTFSTATLTSSNSDTFGETSSRISSSRTAAATSESTSAPSNDAPIRTGSSAALILGIVAAVMLH